MKWIISKDGSDFLSLEGDVAIREDVPAPPVPVPPPVPDPRAISINPTSGPSGTYVTITAANWGANTYYEIWVSGAQYINYRADAAGNINMPVQIPMPADGRILPSFDIRVLSPGGYSDTKTFTVVSTPLPTITITPTSGPLHQAIVITGSGFQLNDHIDLYENGGSGQNHISKTQADLNGNFTFPTLMPPAGDSNTYPGTIAITAIVSGQTAGPSAVFTVTTPTPTPAPPSGKASITLAPSSGAIRTSVTITGTGFLPNHTITLLENDSYVYGTVSDSNGNFMLSDWTIPTNVVTGLTFYTIAASDTASKVGATFTVTS